jgi:hypothetical protein
MQQARVKIIPGAGLNILGMDGAASAANARIAGKPSLPSVKFILFRTGIM